jgi:hypothetical protein
VGGGDGKGEGVALTTSACGPCQQRHTTRAVSRFGWPLCHAAGGGAGGRGEVGFCPLLEGQHTCSRAELAYLWRHHTSRDAPARLSDDVDGQCAAGGVFGVGGVAALSQTACQIHPVVAILVVRPGIVPAAKARELAC